MDQLADKSNGSQSVACSEAEVHTVASQLRLVMSWSVSYSLSQLDSSAKEEPLSPQDFIGVHRVTVSMEHFRVSSGLPSSFQFKEYCPRVFAQLRQNFGSANCASGVSCSEDFRAAWTTQLPAWDAESRGHSSSRFLRSSDGAFFAKTIQQGEVATLRRMLPDYWGHVTDSRIDSLLPQLLALYRITMAGSKVYILFMRSVFNSGHRLIKKYDLKGCRVGRRATKADAARQSVPTQKDLDFIAAGECLSVGPAAKADVMERLRRDVAFLQSHNIMDYSLLVGVHRWAADCSEDQRTQCSDQLPQPTAERQSFNRYQIPYVADPADPLAGQQFYSLGVIDILTDYGLMKRAVSACKRVRYSAAGHDNTFSTVAPDAYAKRFLRFADSCFQ